MYGYPGQPASPYGLPFPPKKRGRKTDAAKLAASNHDLFTAELILASAPVPVRAVSHPREDKAALDAAYMANYGAAGPTPAAGGVPFGGDPAEGGKRLYVPVTRKVSLISSRKDGLNVS